MADAGFERTDTPEGFRIEGRLGAIEVRELGRGVIGIQYWGAVYESLVDAVAAFLDGVIQEGHKIVLAVDASEQGAADPGFRRAWAAWLEGNRESIERMFVLHASSLVKMSMGYLSPRVPGVIELFEDRDAYREAVEQALQTHGTRSSEPDLIDSQAIRLPAPDGIQTDTSRWPLIVVTTPGSVTDQQMAEYLVSSEKLRKKKNEPHVFVLDLRRTRKLSPVQRKMLTDQMETSENLALVKGAAMVFSSPMLRGVLTAIFWIRRPAYPTRVFNTLDAACDWALLQMSL